MATQQVIAGRYQIEHLIGSGAMGDVLRGTDLESGMTVAVKRLKPELVSRDLEMVKRFEREGEALRVLNHPNIVKMLTACSEHGQYYLVMEYVAGGSLRDALREIPQLPVRRALQIALDLADALTRAHRLGIIHRDVKPENVLLAEDDTPRLTDFGVAHVGGGDTLTAEGTLIGTYAYLSPEALLGKPLDERADIWAFGVMLFEMLTGTRPFQGDLPGTVISAILREPVPDFSNYRADVPEAVQDLIYRMLEKNEGDRIGSVRQVGAGLEDLLKGLDTGTIHSVSGVSRQRTEPISGPRFESISTSGSRITNLPAQTTPFIGRHKELVEIEDMLSSADCRLVTLIGPGGMGKTRLSIEAAGRQTSGPYTHGVYFVPLAPLPEDDPIISTLAESISFTFGPGDLDMQLINYLREKNMLLVMDNFEHVLPRASLVDAILNAAPGVKVLATSRSRLNIQSECLYDVPPMEIPRSSSPASIEQVEAVQMFLAYARRVQPGFSLEDGDYAPVIEICRLVDGLPLGLELAASWLRLLSPVEIAEELRQSLDFLESDSRGLPERHRSLRGVFEYSWKLASEEEKQAYLGLTVFRGGFTREAAKEVAGTSLMALRGLVDKSLVRRNPDGRYFIHGLLHQYGKELLEANPAADTATHKKHSAYYLQLLKKIDLNNLGDRFEKTMDELDTEHENMHVALKWAIEERQAEDIQAVIEVVARYLEVRGRYPDMLNLFGLIHSTFNKPEDGLIYAHAAARYATALQRMSRYREAAPLLNESIAHLRQLNELRLLGLVLNWLSYNLMIEGDISGAVASSEEGNRLIESVDKNPDSYFEAQLGYVLFLAGEYQRARSVMRHSLEQALKTGSLLGAAYGYNNIGEVEQVLGNLDEALRLYQEANRAFSQMRNMRGMAFTLTNIGRVAAIKQDYDTASDHYMRALAFQRDIGDRWGIATTLYTLAEITLVQGNTISADAMYRESYAIRSDIGDRLGLMESSHGLGRLAFGQGDLSDARAAFKESLTHAQQAGASLGQANALIYLALVDLMDGQYQAALSRTRDAQPLLDEQEDTRANALAAAASGIAHLAMGNLEAATSDLTNSRELAQQAGSAFPFCLSTGGLARLGLVRQDVGSAQAYLREAAKAALEERLHAAGVWLLGPLAWLYAELGEHERAAELCGHLLKAPDVPLWDREKIDELLPIIGAALQGTVFQNALERGESLVSSALLAQFQA